MAHVKLPSTEIPKDFSKTWFYCSFLFLLGHPLQGPWGPPLQGPLTGAPLQGPPDRALQSPPLERSGASCRRAQAASGVALLGARPGLAFGCRLGFGLGFALDFLIWLDLAWIWFHSDFDFYLDLAWFRF